jgi:hypothetical protein
VGSRRARKVPAPNQLPSVMRGGAAVNSGAPTRTIGGTGAPSLRQTYAQALR